MSIFSENKLLLGAVGIALSSVAVGYVVGRRHKKMFSNYSWKTLSGSNDVVMQYLLDHGIREPESLRKLREVRFSKFCNPNKTLLWRKGNDRSVWAHFGRGYKFMSLLLQVTFHGQTHSTDHRASVKLAWVSASLILQGHPTSILGKYLFGRRFEI